MSDELREVKRIGPKISGAICDALLDQNAHATPRIITLVCRGGNSFDVHEGEAYCDRLCWDEMLGQIACMTHPSINQPRYQMLTPEQHEAIGERWKKHAAEAVTVEP